MYSLTSPLFFSIVASNSLLITFSYLFIILLVGGVGTYFYFNEPVKRFETYFSSGKYKQAIDTYNENSNDSNFKNSINEYLKNKLYELKTSFNDEKIKRPNYNLDGHKKSKT